MPLFEGYDEPPPLGPDSGDEGSDLSPPPTLLDDGWWWPPSTDGESAAIPAPALMARVGVALPQPNPSGKEASSGQGSTNDEASQAAKRAAVREAWLEDLESIRRPEPLYQFAHVATLAVALGPMKPTSAKAGQTGSSAKPVTLDGKDSDGDAAAANVAAAKAPDASAAAAAKTAADNVAAAKAVAAKLAADIAAATKAAADIAAAANAAAAKNAADNAAAAKTAADIAAATKAAADIAAANKAAADIAAAANAAAAKNAADNAAAAKNAADLVAAGKAAVADAEAAAAKTAAATTTGQKRGRDSGGGNQGGTKAPASPPAKKQKLETAPNPDDGASLVWLAQPNNGTGTGTGPGGTTGGAGAPDDDDDNFILRLRGGGPVRKATKATKAKKGNAAAAAAAAVPPEPLAFYGHGATDDTTRYQLRKEDVGSVPGPGALRLDNAKLMMDLKIKNPTKAFTENHPSWGVLHEDYADDFGKAMKEWAKDPSKVPLIKGLPMVEEITFFRVANYKDPGICYWRAISHLIYGLPDYWARVKAEHIDYFSKVLNNQNHPRNGRYTALNKRYQDVSVSGVPAGPGGVSWVRLNPFQNLHVRNAWVPATMLEITTDLYGVFLVLYTIAKVGEVETVTDVMTRGVFNARHLFLSFVGGNHFQPLTPNDYFGWEFQCPRITRDVVKRYTGRRERRADATDAGHGIVLSWRLDLTSDNTAVLPPVPVENILGGMGIKNKGDALKPVLWERTT